MKFSSILGVFSTLLPLIELAVAEPKGTDEIIPVRDFSDPEVISKRGLADRDKLFGQDGNGPVFWAYAKLAYDDEYNDQSGKKLAGDQSKPWGKLAGGDIDVKGVAGGSVTSGLTPWKKFTGMKGIVALDKARKVVVMSFIGSNDRPTFKQDLKFPQIHSGGFEGKVHEGFFECYESVHKTLFDWTVSWAKENPTFDIVITGHSLGGATAHVAAVAFVHENADLKDRITVFTYGAPRAGDMEFQKKLESNQGDRMANFRHIHDIVPYLPFVNQDFIDRYGNPSGRWVFKPSGKGESWFDPNLWEYRPDADDQRGGIKDGTVSIARDMMEKFAQHTTYFTDGGAPSKRVVRMKPTSAQRRRNLAKREAPTHDEFRHAEGLMGEMRVSGELTNPPEELTDNMHDFSKDLKIVSEETEMLDYLKALGSEEDRIDFLGFIKTVAANRD